MTNSQHNYHTPELVEQAFYEALEAGDVVALMDVWANHGQLVCIHPSGPRLLGFDDIRDSWRDILSAGPLQIRVTPVCHIQSGNIAIHNVVEQVLMTGGGGAEPQLVMVNATNIYQNGPTGWRLVMHHASPAMDDEFFDDDADDEPDEGEPSEHTLL